MATLHVDCTTCSARGAGCADCVISLLLGAPDDVGLEDEERSALAVLADAGLVPPLRLAGAAGSPGDTPSAARHAGPTGGPARGGETHRRAV
ncbi:hypothetical protein [Tessaracoccus lapidicaptus]|uniref:hypothetical protein n=1 Tax=Tessaracoccus lapidicaptus TaxID=1427523 RepID=UPI0033417E70